MITLTVPYPVSANRYWATRVVTAKGGRPMAMTYITPEAKAYRQEIAAIAKAAGISQLLTGRVSMHLQLYPHRPLDWKARQRKLGDLWDDTVQCIDLGNAEKVLGDALQGCVLVDDKQIWQHTKERMEPDAGEARMVVTIQAIPRRVAQLEIAA